VRYFPVQERSFAAMSSGVPTAMISPPPSPPSGPRSITQSAGLDDVQVVLDDDDGIAFIAQAMQHVQQLLHVMEMQTRGRLIEDVERASGGALGELTREFHALRFAAGEGGGVLPEAHVRESTSVKVCSLPAAAGTFWKKRAASSTVMSSTSWMFLPPVADLDVSRCSAGPCTHRTAHTRRGGMHLYPEDPVSLAGLAAAALTLKLKRPAS